MKWIWDTSTIYLICLLLKKKTFFVTFEVSVSFHESLIFWYNLQWWYVLPWLNKFQNERKSTKLSLYIRFCIWNKFILLSAWRDLQTFFMKWRETNAIMQSNDTVIDSNHTSQVEWNNWSIIIAAQWLISVLCWKERREISDLKI